MANCLLTRRWVAKELAVTLKRQSGAWYDVVVWHDSGCYEIVTGPHDDGPHSGVLLPFQFTAQEILSLKPSEVAPFARAAWERIAGTWQSVFRGTELYEASE